MHINNYKVKCPQGYHSVKVCMSEKCKHPPLFCDQSDCDCQNIHSKCIKIINLKAIEKNFTDKNTTLLSCLNSLSNWYHRSIKILNIQLNQIIQMKDTIFYSLSPNEAQFHRILTEGQSKKVTRQLVFDIIHSINNSDDNYNQQFRSIDKLLEVQTQKFDDILKRVTEMLPNKNNNHLKKNTREKHIHKVTISQNLHHKDVKIKGNKIIQINQSEHAVTLFEPSLELRTQNIQKFRFKIINTKHSNIFLGVCHRKIVLKHGFSVPNAYEGGLYMVSCKNGFTFSHSLSSQNFKKSPISQIAVGETIEIQYQKGAKQLIVTNVTKGQSAKLSLKSIEGDPFYLAVRTSDENDEVEYLGQVIERSKNSQE